MKSPLFYIKKFKTQIMNLSIYFVAALIPMILSLLSNPFIAKNLSPTDYAIVGYYTAFNTLFGPFVSFYLLHYYTKRFYELNEEKRKELKATIFKSLIVFSLLLTSLALIIIYIYRIFQYRNTVAIFTICSVVLVLFTTNWNIHFELDRV